jgi:PAS domain S-box-containing protein
VVEAVRDANGSLVDLRILYGNAAYWVLTGMDATTGTGRTFASIAPDIDWTTGIAGRLFEALESGRAYANRRIQNRLQTGAQAGQDRVFDVEFAGDADHMSVRIRDVTDDVRRVDQQVAEARRTAELVLERRDVEDRLAGSRARFEAVFELAPIAMIAVDSDRSVRYNQSALELYARSNDEMVRLAFQPDAPWIPPDQADHWEEMRRRVAAGERLRGERLAIIRPTGERREIEGSSIQIVTPDGALGGVVTVMMDMTDQLSLESQFRHAQKMEALGRLAGGIAHDFNNVLMAIMGYADLVADRAWAGRPVDPDHADQVLAATRRAVELTARLTTFARRETVRVETIDVAQMVRDLLPLLERLTPESIEIETRLNRAPPVTIDRSEFEQAIVNLVVNAMDAMPAGGRMVIEVDPVDLDADHAATHLGSMSGPHVLVAVSDTGSGMDDATRSRIFEPFYTTKAPGEGTGLGLAMVFAAIDRAHGQIWVYSEPFHGTTFKIYLPAAPSDEPETPVETIVRADPIGGSEALLLVEDEPMVRDLLVTILSAAGYAVTAAARPSEAFAVAADHHFDLLVSDVVMPDMMGTEMAARLRESQPELRVVLMSGYTANAVGYELGPRDSFVHKPIRPSEVLRVVRESLDR